MNSQDVADSVSAAMEESECHASSAGLGQVLLLSDKELRDVEWVYMLSTKRELPTAFALEIGSTTRGSEIIQYQIFDTRLLKISEEIPAKEHNRQVKNAWLKLCSSSSDDAENWLEILSNISMKSIRQLVKRELARKDLEF